MVLTAVVFASPLFEKEGLGEIIQINPSIEVFWSPKLALVALKKGEQLQLRNMHKLI